MPEYEFELILGDGADVRDGEVIDALFEAGCEDAVFGITAGTQIAGFVREAPSLYDAVLSAIGDVERAAPGLQVLRVSPDELVTASEIAERLGRTRASVRQLIAGDRGPGTFPAPVSHLGRRNPLWAWPEVAVWARDHLGVPVESEALEYWTAVSVLNAALALRERLAPLPAQQRTAVRALLPA